MILETLSSLIRNIALLGLFSSSSNQRISLEVSACSLVMINGNLSQIDMETKLLLIFKRVSKTIYN